MAQTQYGADVNNSTGLSNNMMNNSEQNNETNVLDRAVLALQAGKTAVFPTDTVYGLGVAVAYCKNPVQVYRIKNRSEAKPLAWLVSGVDSLDVYGKQVPAWAYDAARTHWPGALTLVVRASENVPLCYQSKQHTIGLRMPASDIAHALIQRVGCPLATTSANISGKPAPSCNSQLDENVLRRVHAVVRGVDCSGGAGVASTVIDCTGAHPVVLRQGSVMLECAR